MTKDTKTEMFYFSSNYIFWWNPITHQETGVPTMQALIPEMFKFDMATNTLSVDYDKEWVVSNCLGQVVAKGNGKTIKNLSYLSAGTYIISPKEILWSKNKFVIAR